MLSRTLLIGLGGTGVNVLRKFKNHFLKYYDREQRYVRLLGIDTTDQEETGDPRLANQEFLHLGDPPIGAAEIFQWRDHDPFRWIPRDMPAFDIASGAGQRRLIGHIAYFWRGADIAARIQAAMDSLYAADVSREFLGLRDGAQTRVFVVSSLCGGTGTGMFLDIGYMVRHIFAQQARQTVSFSVLFLPSAFRDLTNDPQFPNLQANGYAALQELNYYMQDGIEEREMDSPIPGNPKIPILANPFNMNFLLGSPDEMGRVLPSSRELYQRTAEFLFAAVAFPQIQVQLVDYLAVNGRLSYATFGSFTIPLPKSRYVERYLRDMGRELLEDVLSPSAAASLPSADEMLAGTGIDLLARGGEAGGVALGQLTEIKEIAYVLQSAVFHHATPSNQKDATKAISDEYAAWMSMRPEQWTKANGSIAKIASAMEQRIEEQRGQLARLDKGSLSTMRAFLESVTGKIDAILPSPGGSQFPGESEVFEKYREDKSILGMGGLKPIDRLNGFRAELTEAAQAQMGEDCRLAARTVLGQLRNRLNESKSAIDVALRNSPAILADFQTKSEKFLSERRAASNAQNLIAAGIGQGAIPPDQYESDRIGLLQRCRSRMKLDALLDANSRANLDRFIDQLYAQTSGYVSERVTTAQLLDPEALRDGLNQAWTNLSLRQVPGAQRWVINRLFAPQDPPLRAEIKTIVDQWRGIGNGTEFADPVDDSILSFLRIVGRFNVDEIVEVRQQLKQAYDAKMRNPNDALFLNLPTHRSHDVVVQDAEGEKSRQYALATIFGVLQEFGQSVEFGGVVLRPDIADPLERRKSVRDRLLNPDAIRKTQNAVRKKREKLGSQPAFADFVHEQIGVHYPESEADEESELGRLIDHERSQALLYLQSLGVRRYLAAGGAE